MALQFHALSFEGPDAYARAGGIASRIDGLTQAIGAAGFESHLWFVGDPSRPPRERSRGVELHRWCQWISAHHPAGVYDGEEGKRRDFARSLPPALCEAHLRDLRERGDFAVILAEEWHTADAVLHLDGWLRSRGIRDRVLILWNANNLFGFDRIDWPALSRAAAITTVSRYMKHRMAALGIGALAIPNGVPRDAFERPDPRAASELRTRLADRLVLAKMARFDPDKRWNCAVGIVAELKHRGLRPLLVARGGIESYGGDVLARAHELGLSVSQRELPAPGPAGLISAMEGLDRVDFVDLRSSVDPEGRRLLLGGADAVLANSGHEPFGLVGLETMAVEGLACTGCTGEEYAVAGRNAIVLQTADPAEFVEFFLRLRRDRTREAAVRRAGRSMARQFRWSEILRLHLFPRLSLLGGAAFAEALDPFQDSYSRPRQRSRALVASPVARAVRPDSAGIPDGRCGATDPKTSAARPLRAFATLAASRQALAPSSPAAPRRESGPSGITA